MKCWGMVLTMVCLIGACGGGKTDVEPVSTAPSNPYDFRVEPTSVAIPAMGAEFGAMVTASDGGVWVAGSEKGLAGRAFMFKQGGATPNPCGEDGVRWLDELSILVERHPFITAMTSPHDGKFYVGGRGPGGVFVSRYLEGTCRPDPDFGTNGHVPLPHASLAGPNDIRLVEDLAGNVITIENNSGRVTLRRVSLSGTLDATFGNGGTVANTNVDNFSLGGAGISATGDIYIAGAVEAKFSYRPAIWKLNQNGETMTEFGTDGIQRYPELSKGTGAALNILVEADRLVFSGNTASSVALDSITTNDSFIAAADLSTGMLLPEFGHSGGVIWDWGFNNSNMISTLIRTRKGGYATCGHAIISFLSGQLASVAEFTPDGQEDSSVGYQGRRLIQTTDQVAGCGGMAYDGNGRLFFGAQDSAEALVLTID